jgi:hypothetical protein
MIRTLVSTIAVLSTLVVGSGLILLPLAAEVAPRQDPASREAEFRPGTYPNVRRFDAHGVLVRDFSVHGAPPPRLLIY